jgi:hypothetical protein
MALLSQKFGVSRAAEVMLTMEVLYQLSYPGGTIHFSGGQLTLNSRLPRIGAHGNEAETDRELDAGRESGSGSRKARIPRNDARAAGRAGDQALKRPV